MTQSLYEMCDVLLLDNSRNEELERVEVETYILFEVLTADKIETKTLIDTHLKTCVVINAIAQFEHVW